MRVRNANCSVFVSEVFAVLGGTSSTFSQNTDSRSCGSASPAYIMRSVCDFFASMRKIGGVSTNGALDSPGFASALPVHPDLNQRWLGAIVGELDCHLTVFKG